MGKVILRCEKKAEISEIIPELEPKEAMTSCGLVPKNRLRLIPKEYRLVHEYCYFLHDECARLLVEYEKGRGHIVSFNFKDKAEAKLFKKLKCDPIEAMRKIGRSEEAKRVIINTITMAMVSDCLHHLYEALQCSEKRKFVVAFNLLRKPLTDSLFFLSWMLGDEEDFYRNFTANSPEALSSKNVGNRRPEIFSKAIAKTKVGSYIQADDLASTIYDRKNAQGLYALFQQAVHLITVERIEIKTSPEDFNFIFNGPFEDDSYEGLYFHLPYILLFLSHVVLELFARMHPMDIGAKSAFECRSILAYWLFQSDEDAENCMELLQNGLDQIFSCPSCSRSLSVTHHNASRILLSESYRCVHCQTVSDLPFSYLFQSRMDAQP